MKALLTGALLLNVGIAQAAELSSFADAQLALQQGKLLTFSVTVNECAMTMAKNMSAPKATFVIKPNAVALVEGGVITASNRHFTLDDPEFSGKPIFGYSKFVLTADNQMTVKIVRMNASNYAELGKIQLNCQVGKGVQLFSR